MSEEVEITGLGMLFDPSLQSTVRIRENNRYRYYHIICSGRKFAMQFIKNPDFNILGLPEDSKIIEHHFDFNPNSFELLIESQEFDVVDHYHYPCIKIDLVNWRRKKKRNKRYRYYYIVCPGIIFDKQFIKNPDFNILGLPKDSKIIDYYLGFNTTRVFLLLESQEFEAVDRYHYPHIIIDLTKSEV